jgi:2-keto-4-pentenoate hydratase
MADPVIEELLAAREHHRAIAPPSAERRLALEAGDLVMSGSVSTLLRPKAGDSVRAAFTRLGSVGVRFV